MDIMRLLDRSIGNSNAILFFFLGAFEKWRKAAISFVMCVSVCTSVRPHGTIRLPLDGF